MFLEAGSQREVLISLLFELIVQITVLWRGKQRREEGGEKGEEQGGENDKRKAVCRGTGGGR